MTGGNFPLNGGFWSLFAVQTLDAPPLTIQLIGDEHRARFLAVAFDGFRSSAEHWPQHTQLGCAAAKHNRRRHGQDPSSSTRQRAIASIDCSNPKHLIRNSITKS